MLKSSHEHDFSLPANVPSIKTTLAVFNDAIELGSTPAQTTPVNALLGVEDLEQLYRFQELTVGTFGPTRSRDIFYSQFEKYAMDVCLLHAPSLHQSDRI